MFIPLASEDLQSPWFPVRDADPRARALYERHYSCRTYKDGRSRHKFIGPGEYMCLMTIQCDSLFIWRKFKDDSGQQGINCSVFRNESSMRSSFLIRHAMALATLRWPGERFYTYINPTRVLSTNPGYCFYCAGWRKCGVTKGGLIIMEYVPGRI